MPVLALVYVNKYLQSSKLPNHIQLKLFPVFCLVFKNTKGKASYLQVAGFYLELKTILLTKKTIKTAIKETINPANLFLHLNSYMEYEIVSANISKDKTNIAKLINIIHHLYSFVSKYPDFTEVVTFTLKLLEE